ncbi:MAG: 3-deoxy-7-phosphoheptulonate synthase [bacterium]|nr:3-deoxy-7-phosphoheptulonate synthase [bacterium]
MAIGTHIPAHQNIGFPGATEPQFAPPGVLKVEGSEAHLVRVGDVVFGGSELILIAGPCAVESEAQIRASANLAKQAGAKLLRGGGYKPRTSPYSFQGYGYEAIRMMRDAADEFGLKIVTEVMDPEHVDLLEPIADMLQIGSRNMQNFSLLRRAGKSKRPVLLKRGMSSTLFELLNAAEYILAEGNDQIVLCERGIRTFDDFSRSTFDLTIIPKIKQISRLPIIADPSHATGDRSLVLPVAQAAIAAGADGLIVEFHPDPKVALSDGDQSLYPEQLFELSDKIAILASAVNRRFER